MHVLLLLLTTTTVIKNQSTSPSIHPTSFPRQMSLSRDAAHSPAVHQSTSSEDVTIMNSVGLGLATTIQPVTPPSPSSTVTPHSPFNPTSPYRQCVRCTVSKLAFNAPSTWQVTSGREAESCPGTTGPHQQRCLCL